MTFKPQAGVGAILILAAISCVGGVGAPYVISWADTQESPAKDAPEPSEAKPKPVLIKGRVVKKGDGSGLAACDVTFTIAGGRGETVKTDQSGQFTFTGPPGKYTITAAAGGKTATVGHEVLKDFALPKPLELDVEH